MKTEECRKIANDFGTPVYVFDLESLEKRVSEIRRIADGRFHICYSIKANPFLVSCMERLVDHLEVCSPGELAVCEHLNVAPEKILYSGVNKTEADIREAMTYNVDIFTAESLLHMELISAEAVRQNKIAKVYPRLSAGSQFGMSKDDLFMIIDHPELYPNTEVKGIHYFAGTQRHKAAKMQKELAMLKEFWNELESEHHFKPEVLEYGPGCYVPMFADEDYSDTLKPLREIADDLAAVSEFADLTIEMGRFYAAECGTYITKVMDTKSTKGVSYAIVDGGINHVSYYGGMMGMKCPVIERITESEDTETKEWCLCGSLCTTNDILVRGIQFTGLQRGDLLCFKNIGAYSVTEGMYLFLSRTMPKVILRNKEGDYEVARDFMESWKINTK